MAASCWHRFSRTSIRGSPRSSTTMLEPSLTTTQAMARGYEVVSGAAPRWGRRAVQAVLSRGLRGRAVPGRTPRVLRNAGARVGHRLELAGRQRVHDHLCPAWVVIAGLAAERRVADLAVAQDLIQERDVRVRRDVARGARRVLLLKLRRVGRQPGGVGVPAEAVTRMGLEVQLVEVTVRGVPVPTLVLELVVDQRIPPLVVQAAARTEEGRIGRPAGAGRAGVGVWDEDHTPGLVVGEPVVDDRVVAPAGYGHSGADRASRGRSRAGHVGIVVVMDVVVHEHPAPDGALHRR